MKISITTILTAVFAALSSASAVPQHPKDFSLKVSGGVYGLTGSAVTFGTKGFGVYMGQPRFKGRITDDSHHGTIVSAKNAGDIVYLLPLPGPSHQPSTDTKASFLRPTHGTPQYFLSLGDPSQDAAPSLTEYTDWTISQNKTEDAAAHFWLNYNVEGDGGDKNWVACGSSDALNSGDYGLY